MCGLYMIVAQQPLTNTHDVYFRAINSMYDTRKDSSSIFLTVLGTTKYVQVTCEHRKIKRYTFRETYAKLFERNPESTERPN